MANTVSNNKISHLINSQVPFFVRNDHQTFVAFLEAYYEYLEQDAKVINRIKNTETYYDIDRTLDEFTEHLYSTFLDTLKRIDTTDKNLLIKNIKDFYRARGTEKSVRFLMRILFDGEEIDFYYPKKDILIASDGKWYVEKAVRIEDVKIDGVLTTSLSDIENFVSTRITGLKSEASAIVERVDRFYNTGAQVDEIILSNIIGSFEQGEQIEATFNDVEEEKTITANIISGVISSITIGNPGSLYEVGDPVIIVSNTGSGACASIASVTSGNISSIVILEAGAGYRVNDAVVIIGGGGSGASANVANVNTNETIHPNTYNITNSTILLEANTALNNTQYTNLNATTISSAIEDGLNFWQYSNTGPLEIIRINSPGAGYSTPPTISVTSNSAIRSLGIVGRLKIISGGQNYAIGDMIYIENVAGGYGSGALANVWNVDTANNDTISEVRLIPMEGHIVGGSGYSMDYLPTCNIDSGTGSGANVIVKSLLGYGGSLQAANTTIGAIERIIITSGGIGYEGLANVDLTGSGDGLATANATVLTGVFSYEGRYLNDDGHLSSYNFLQDRDYYQKFSYVIRTKQSIEAYRSYLKTLVHPSGTKMFGEVQIQDTTITCNVIPEALPDYTSTIRFAELTWANANGAFFNPTIYYPSHGLEIGNTITLEFDSGNVFNIAVNTSTYTPNGVYVVSNVNNSDVVEVYSGKWLQGSRNTYTISEIWSPYGLYFEPEGQKVFIFDRSNDRMYECNAGRSWDITSISAGRFSGDLSAYENDQMHADFRPDGNTFYIAGQQTGTIHQFAMSEKWNVNSASYSISSNANVWAEFGETALTCFCFGANGSNLYISGGTNDVIYQYQLSEAWNVNTASYITEQSISSVGIGAPQDIILNDSGNTMFVWDSFDDQLYTFSLANNWNVNAAVHLANSISPPLTGSYGSLTSQVQFKPDGTMLYMIDQTRYIVSQMPLTEAWNANTIIVHTSSTENVLVGKMI